MTTQNSNLPRLPLLLYIIFLNLFAIGLIIHTFSWNFSFEIEQWLFLISLSLGITVLSRYDIPIMGQSNDDYSMDSSFYLGCLFLLGLDQTLLILLFGTISYAIAIKSNIFQNKVGVKRNFFMHLTNFSIYAIGLIFAYYSFNLFNGQVGSFSLDVFYAYVIALIGFMVTNISITCVFYALKTNQNPLLLLKQTFSFFIPTYFIDLLLSIVICILLDSYKLFGFFLFLSIVIIISRVFIKNYEYYHELNEKKLELEQIFNQVEVAIFTKKLNDDRIVISKAVEKIFGVPQENFTKLKWHEMIHPDDRTKVQAFNENKIKEKVELRYRIIHRSGEIRYLNEVINPVYNENGEKVKVSGVVFDVTEKKESEQRIKEMENDIQHAERIKLVGELAASVAHEIRNPLTTVKGFLQLFHKHKEIPKDSKFFIQLSLDELDRANNIISDYLSLGKSAETNVEEINLIQELQNIIDSVSSFALLHKVELTFQYDTEYLNINLNRGNIRQVLLNIIKNGIEASSSSSNGNVNVRITNKKYITSIEVTDNGVGMTPEEVGRLGLPFYSTKEKGTGLGMMVCYKIIDSMKGNIQVQSEKGKGTSFSIILPKEKLKDKRS